MSNRVTTAQLMYLVNSINKLTGSPLTYSTKGVVPFSSHIGHYHLNQAYGGVGLVRTDNTSGGVSTIFNITTKRELYNLMAAFIKGIDIKNTELNAQ